MIKWLKSLKVKIKNKKMIKIQTKLNEFLKLIGFI